MIWKNDCKIKHLKTGLAIFVAILIQTLVLHYSGINNDVTFLHSTKLPMAQLLKIALFIICFILFYNGIKENIIDPDTAFLIFYTIIFFSTIIFWGAYYKNINSIDFYNNRPNPKWIGGSNAYAFILSIFAVLLDFKHYTSYNKRICILLLFFTGIFFLAYDYLCVRYLNYSLATAGSAMVNSNSTIVNYTSGRSAQWADILHKILSVNIPHYFIGYGVGHYAWQATFDVESEAQNTYLQWIYEYGFLAGLFLIFYVGRLALKIQWFCLNPAYRLAKSFAIVMALTFFVEGVYSTQTVWLLALLSAYIAIEINENSFRVTQ